MSGKRIALFFLAGMLIAFGVMQASARVAAAAPETDVTTETAPENMIKLDAPKITYLGATSKGVMKLEWKKIRRAERYTIYRASGRKGNYKKIGTSKKNYFSDKKGKAGKQYCYKVAAAVQDKVTLEWCQGRMSAAKKGTVRKNAKRIAYVGDSIMTGFSHYRVVGKGTRVFAKIGQHATTFYNSALMQQMLYYKPDRIVMMFGMNGMQSLGRWSVENQIECIGRILKKCRKQNPDVEIVVLGVSPVGARAGAITNGNIKVFNQKLKKSLKGYEYAHYYDLSKVLAAPGGGLKSSYDGGDGIHWSPEAYKVVYRAINQYVKEWEQ